ncbi:hypothetical protein [Ferviditalea candida]|uniref:Molybdopterin cofactor biosynthesis MoaD-related C-terminal domain-containing protein n=1 Tax=Ferviditalea candida TaxID=3108399 RepID=A0ABU5ZJ71_9BACL|nr:hypothetical protein [Paenibacillaceae bacterium T2]
MRKITKKTLEIRGIYRKYLVHYLIELDGAKENSTPQLSFTGNGWTCTLSQEEYFTFLQSQVPIVNVTLQAGNSEILDEIVRKFRFKTIRAGG